MWFFEQQFLRVAGVFSALMENMNVQKSMSESVGFCSNKVCFLGVLPGKLTNVP